MIFHSCLRILRTSFRYGYVNALPVMCLTVLVTSACTQTVIATPAPTTITIAGSTGVHPALQALTATFHRQHPNVLFSLRGGGATLGEEQVAAGRIDLAASTLAPDVTQATPPPRPLVRIPIGIDALAIVTHGSKSDLTLTLPQLRELFSGQVLDWSLMNVSTEDVVLISREDRSGARILFESTVMMDESVSLTAVVMPTSEDVVDYVDSNPNAIGYVSRSYVTQQIQRQTMPPTTATPSATQATLNEIYVVPLDGYLPTMEHIRSQDYPILTPIYLSSRREPQGWVRQFVDFVLSPAGQAIVGRYHLPVR